MRTKSRKVESRWAFRRITSSAKYVPEIDGIRFVAISAVFVFHLAGDVLRHSTPGANGALRSDPFFWTTQVLNIGVQLFFVLSGYVLALPFVRQFRDGGAAVNLKHYLLRRVTRIEPPYVISLFLLFFLKLAVGRSGASALIPHLAASLGYVHNLVYGRPSDINFVAWSLEIEVQFYLLAPFLCFLFFRSQSVWQRRSTLAVFCIACGAAGALVGNSPWIALSLAGQMPYFLAGLLLAETSSSVSQARAESRMFWDVACLGLALLLFYWIHLGWALPYAGALTIFGCYWTALRSRWVARFLRVGFVSAVGGMCYSVYLLHNYVIGFAGQYTEKIATGQPFALRLLIEACLLGPAVLLVSGVFYLLFERPCMRPDWPARLRVWWSSQAEKSAVDVPEGKQMERMDCFVEESVPKPG